MSDSSSFVHLHVHSEFSLLDGAIRIDKMLEKAKALGMQAAAVTDHGNMFGAVELFSFAPKIGIKPILGCEVYVAPGSRKDRSPATAVSESAGMAARPPWPTCGSRKA